MNMLLVLLMKNVQETSAEISAAEHTHLDGVLVFQIQENLGIKTNVQRDIESWIPRSGKKKIL